jgi:Ca-activated chloride channel family protein
MHFGEPKMFLLFWAVIVLGLFLRWSLQNRTLKMRRFVEAKLLPDVLQHFDAQRIVVKYILLISTVILSVVALARPQWGFEWQQIKRRGTDILLVVDTSRSMLTRDVKPNRLERTKLAVKDLVKNLNGDRIGLIAFAGEAFLLCPLTVDYNGFLLSLEDLDAGSIPRGGTNLDVAIKTALKQYQETPNQYKAVIVVTDGDNLEGDPIAAAELAKKEGVRVYTVGIGTKEGELIQIVNEQGALEFLKDKDGNFVKSRLNEKLLEEIALKTQGVYVRAAGAQFGLDLLYEKEISKIEKREFDAKMEKKYHERFQLPLTLAFILLVMETCVSTRKQQKQSVL